MKVYKWGNTKRNMDEQNKGTNDRYRENQICWVWEKSLRSKGVTRKE